MKKTIDQFMWGFQSHFRTRVQYEIQKALSAIGLQVDVRVVLVGFALDGSARHKICVEPEHDSLSVDHLAEVSTRATELFQADPESQIMHSVARLHELRREQIFRRSRAAAVVEAIEASGAFQGLRFFVSAAAPIGGYEVHTCAGVPAEAVDALPAFDESVVDRFYVGRSLQHEVITECLHRADRALYFPDPGADIYTLGAPTEEIVRAAADRLTRGTVWRATGMPADLLSAVNAFTSLSYERVGAGGRLVIAQREKAASGMLLRFQQPVSLRAARTMRKLLELSDDSTAVLADYKDAYGLGSCDSGPDVVEISVHGRSEWELNVDGSAFVRVAHGHAMLPRPALPFEKFKDTVERTVDSAEINRIWEITQEAQASGHGTTLVVSSDPVQEIARLGGEAVPIDPECLEPADIARLGGVDGAVLLGPDGSCYAFGVILDGKADRRGDPARGSRFNSALRYQRTAPVSSMLVVISDDGMVDLIPDLRPRVHRDEVEAAVRAFAACCEAESVDGEEFARTHERVKRFAFYLDDGQCRLVNGLHDNEMRRRLEEGGSALSETPLRPNPEMDKSFFL